jgi:hypothetical protein
MGFGAFLAAAITISRGALANVPAGRPERNRIPGKIDEYCKKLLKGGCQLDHPRLLMAKWNPSIVAIETCRP